VVLGAEAHAAVRAAQGAPEQLRVVATATFAEFVAGPLVDAFTRRSAGSVEVSAGVAISGEQGVLVANRLADVAFGPGVPGEHAMHIVSEPVFKYRLGVVAAGHAKLRGPAKSWRWLVGPSGTDPGSGTARLLRRLGIPDSGIGVFPSQTAAWAAAADGAGVAPAIEHLVSPQLRRGRAPPLRQHPRGHAAHAFAHRRHPPVPLQAPRVRHDLELAPPARGGFSPAPAGRYTY